MYFPDSMVYENADAQRALAGYEKAVNMKTFYDTDLRISFVERCLFMMNSGNLNDSTRKNIYNDLLRMKPFIYQDIATNNGQTNHEYQFLARISEQGYILNKNSKDLDDMDKIIQKAILFNPNVSANFQLMGELKILQNNYSDGEAYIKKGCILDNCGEDGLYLRIGSAYSNKGDNNLALKNYEKVIDIRAENKKKIKESPAISISNAKLIDYVASSYCRANNVQDCQRVYKKGSEIYPEYASYFEQRFKAITTQKTE